MRALFFLSVITITVALAQSTFLLRTGLNTPAINALSSKASYLDPGFRRKCPVCDSSVYSYCSDKLFHDSCCCHQPLNPYDRLPYECQFADCSFLHANSCAEHKLITACCCSTLYLFRK